MLLTYLAYWVLWSLFTMLIYYILHTLQRIIGWPSLTRLIITWQRLDNNLIKSHLLNHMSIWKCIIILVWYVVFTLLIIIYLNLVLIFFIYYFIRLVLLRRWEVLEPIYISNLYSHKLVSCFFVLPNAFAYYLLVLGLDLLTTQELITYKQLLYLFVIRSVLGFSPLFVYTLELVLSLDAHTVMGRKVFFDKLLNFYTTILHHYHHRKIIRCDHGYISREEK